MSWAIWPEAVLRSSGFRVDLLDGLDGSAALRRLAALPAFREAVTWQNPSFARSGLAWLARHADRHNWRARANERTALQYLQRYVMRNETVGFFGPAAWAELAAEGPPLALTVGPGLVDERRVAWESWAMAAFARRFGLELPSVSAASAIDMHALTAGTAAAPAWARLSAAASCVAAATGDADALGAAMAALESEFTSLTATTAARAPGQTGAGRTLVREDCRRDARLTIGPALWQHVIPALEWLLIAQRWVTARAGEVWTRRLQHIFDGCALHGRAPMREFFPRAQPVLEGCGATRDTEIHMAARRARSEITALLALPPGERHVERDGRTLAKAAAQRFGEAQPGWPSARYHCPDMHIAAPSVAAADRATLVLGELHSGRNTVDQALFSEIHREPGHIAAAIREDFGHRRVLPVMDPDAANASGQTRGVGDFLFDWRHGLDALEVRTSEAGLVVGAPDGEWPILAFFDQLLGAFGAMLPYLPHTPRLTVDGVVIARERWRVDRGATVLGLPRHIFVRARPADKPLYIDRESRPLADLFANLAQSTESLWITEMLPAPDDCWLTDAAGARYTSELRMVLVDKTA
jgi:hypothetical protein